MSITIVADAVPLRVDSTGVVRVGATRVPIDAVVFSFSLGATPEEIVQQYTSLDLGDVYAVIAYYLRHKTEVDAYLAERERQAERIRHEIEKQFDPSGIRARLLARQQARESAAS